MWKGSPMVKKRRRHMAACKSRIAPEALEGSQTISPYPQQSYALRSALLDPMTTVPLSSQLGQMHSSGRTFSRFRGLVIGANFYAPEV